MKDKFLKGLKDPTKIPPYLIRKVNPGFRKDFRTLKLGESTIYTWDKNFDWGHRSPPETSANNYYYYKSLQYYLDSEFSQALEVGCGWGNVTSWISDYADVTCGIDPNYKALTNGREFYPDINFITGIGQQLPLESGSFDLVVTNTMLMHIPPTDLSSAVEEIIRVLKEEGILLLRENFNPDHQSNSMWGRSKETYYSLFDQLDQIPVEISEEEHIYEMIKLQNSYRGN